MTSYGRGGGFNTYEEMQPYQDDWGKPITKVSDYPDHVCRPVIVDIQGNRSPIVSYSSEHGVEGYVVRAQRIVEVRRSYDIPLNGLLDEYNVHEEWDDHSPRKLVDQLIPLFLSPPKLITHKPSWISEDHDSPKYREHHDFSGSPLHNKFEGLHLQDNRGSIPYKYKKDGYTHSMGSPKASHIKDYGVNNTWDSPPRSRSSYDDWDSRRDPDDYVNKDDYGRPKFNGGYKTTGLPLSQATNDIGTAMQILGGGNKPLASHTYAQQSHFPASYSSPHIKESYPERTHGGKPLASSVSTKPSYYPKSNPITTERKESYPETIQGGKPLASSVSTQPSYYPTSNPLTTERKESYPEPTKGVKPLFSPVYTQQAHSTTSNPAHQKKESYPETAHGSKTLFSPVHTQQPHSPTSNPSPQRKESYPETTHGTKPLFSSVYSQQSHSPTSNPIPQRKESYPETTHGPKPLFSTVYSQQPHSPTSNPIPPRKESYPDTTRGPKPLFSPAYTPQSHSPTSNPTPQRKESYPETDRGIKPMFSSVYTPQAHSPTSTRTSQKKESYPEKAHDTNPMFSPVATQPSHSLTANPTSQNESHPKKTKGWKSLYSPDTKQQPDHPTSHSTPEMKKSNPDHETRGWKPSFSPSSPQRERYIPQMEDHYSDQIQRRESFPPPYENTQEQRYGAIAPPKATMDSSEARKRYANLKPVSAAQMKYSGTIDSREAVQKYKGAFVP
ncbi:unnamed protein product [Withania somnifera]